MAMCYETLPPPESGGQGCIAGVTDPVNLLVTAATVVVTAITVSQSVRVTAVTVNQSVTKTAV